MVALEVPSKVRSLFIHAAVLLSMLDPVRGALEITIVEEHLNVDVIGQN
jgi:hypothetical protein